MALYIFPAHRFHPEEVTARVVESVISGGTALNGEEDVIATDGGGRWEIVYAGIQLDTPELNRLWEAWEGHLKRGTTDCLVPLVSIETAPIASFGRSLMEVSDIVADDPIWPTSVAYSAPVVTATVGASAALRATVLNIVMTTGAPLVGGEKFSIGQRAYRVIRPLGGNQFQIEPPLREAVAVGAAVNFDWPVVKARSAPGESWSTSLRFSRFGEASIRFLENAA